MSDIDRECASCGKKPALGWAWIGYTRYCHPDNVSTTCYMRAVKDEPGSEVWLGAS